MSRATQLAMPGMLVCCGAACDNVLARKPSTAPGRQQRWCSDACRKRHERMRARAAREYAETHP